MKRIYIFLTIMALATAASAQGNKQDNYLGFNLGGGINSIVYSPTDGSAAHGYGFGLGLQYAHFFGKHFGFGVGLNYATYGASATYNKTIHGTATIHPDNGLTYDPINVYDNWRERQTLGVLSVPVEFMYRSDLSKSWAFLLGLGLQLDLPVNASYRAVDGAFETQGFFPITNVTYNNLPDYGFRRYEADPEKQHGDVSVGKNGISLVADLGANHSLKNNWGLYLGIYGGYGLSNLYDTAFSKNNLLSISTEDADVIDYNSTIASGRIDAYNLISVGVKVGVNIGWICKHSGKKNTENESIVPYATENDKEIADRAAEEAKAAAEKAAAEKAAAEEAARQASYANNAELNRAMASIDADIAAAEKAANESGSTEAKAAVKQAKAKATEARNAQKNGKYADSYDLMTVTYGLLADSYAADAQAWAKKNNNDEATKAANDAEIYAKAAHNADLATAMASNNNSNINASKASKAKNTAVATTTTTDNNDKNTNTGNVSNNIALNNNVTTDNYRKAPSSSIDAAVLQQYFERISLGVHFNFNESEPIIDNVTDISMRALGAAMATDNNIQIKCIGHTDSIGSENANNNLGLKRAKAVKSILVDYGAPSNSISTESRGMNEAIAPNDSDENRAKNRRVVILPR